MRIKKIKGDEITIENEEGEEAILNKSELKLFNSATYFEKIEKVDEKIMKEILLNTRK
jgi:hypothetical protein